MERWELREKWGKRKKGGRCKGGCGERETNRSGEQGKFGTEENATEGERQGKTLLMDSRETLKEMEINKDREG